MADYYDSTFTFTGTFSPINDIAKALKIDPGCETCEPLLQNLYPPPDSIVRLDAVDKLNRPCDRHAYLTDWQMEHWGADRENHDCLHISTNLFDWPSPLDCQLSISISTAWSTPEEAARGISKHWPAVTVTYISDTMRDLMMDEISFLAGYQTSGGWMAAA